MFDIFREVEHLDEVTGQSLTVYSSVEKAMNGGGNSGIDEYEYEPDEADFKIVTLSYVLS